MMSDVSDSTKIELQDVYITTGDYSGYLGVPREFQKWRVGIVAKATIIVNGIRVKTDYIEMQAHIPVENMTGEVLYAMFPDVYNHFSNPSKNREES